MPRFTPASEKCFRLRAQTDETEAAAGRSTELQCRVETLTEQVRLLREQLAQIAAALDASDQAAKAEDLPRYRSEFFGRLQQVPGSDPSIRIVGDRFVFQSELLFPSGSDQLSTQGERQFAKLAATLKSITAPIPADIERNSAQALARNRRIEVKLTTP